MLRDAISGVRREVSDFRVGGIHTARECGKPASSYGETRRITLCPLTQNTQQRAPRL
jgi:hypothetical protein